MARSKKSRPLDQWHTQSPNSGTELRIVGGSLGGRKIRYSGDPRTRPMKDVTREAIFNLVGGWVPGKYVIDLFSGTGAVGMEALSRGAKHAWMVERHFPTARLIRENLASLDLTESSTVESADAFFWMRKWLKTPPLDHPWMLFLCPPYAFFRTKKAELIAAITATMAAAPQGSVIVAEAPESVQLDWLPEEPQWRYRDYSPARIAVWRPASYEQFDETPTQAETPNDSEPNDSQPSE